MNRKLQIRDVIQVTGLNRETLRYYEQKGLLPTATRTEAGYREFDSDIIDRLKFIKMAQEVGFSLKEILELLKMGEQKVISKLELKAVVDEKIQNIDERIESLQNMRKLLQNFSKAATRLQKTSDCPILSLFKKLEL